MNLNIDSEILVKATNNLKEVLTKFSKGLVGFFNILNEKTCHFIYKVAKTIVLQGNRKKSILGSNCSRREFLLLKKRSKRFLKEIHRVFGKNPDFSDKSIFTFERTNRNGHKYSIYSIIRNLLEHPKDSKWFKHFILSSITMKKDFLFNKVVLTEEKKSYSKVYEIINN